MTQSAGPPRVSVIIPTYNRSALLRQAIASVVEQTWPYWEVIVADDGSEDDTQAVVESFPGPIRYLRLPHSGRPAIARNQGLQVATGTYVAFLDSDDLMHPNKLAIQVDALEHHPSAALVYANGRFFRDDPQQPIGQVLDGVKPQSGQLFAQLVQGNFLMVATLLIRRSAIDAVGAFNESPDFVSVEDFDLWLRLAARYPFVYLPDHVAYVRRHADSLSYDVVGMRQRLLIVLDTLARNDRELGRQFAQEFSAAEARQHAALSLAYARSGQVWSSIGHAMLSARHPLRWPGSSLRSVWDWHRNRQAREGVRPPK